MPWQLAVALSIVAAVISNLVQRRYAQRSQLPSSIPPALSYILGVTPLGLFFGFVIFPHHITWSPWLLLLLVIQGVAIAVANWLSFIVLKHLSLAVTQTISRFTTIFVIVFGWLLLGETLTVYQLIGAALLTGGALLAIFAPHQQIISLHQRKVHATSVILMLLSATGLGVTLLIEKTLLRHMDIGGVYIVGWLMQTLAMIVIASKDLSRQIISRINTRELLSSLQLGLSAGLAGIFYVYAIYKSDNVSLVNSLITVSLPLTVFGAYVFLHERDNPKILWVALVLAFVGLLISSMH